MDPYTEHEMPALASRALTHAYAATAVGMPGLFVMEVVARRFGFADDHIGDAALRCLGPAALGLSCMLLERRWPISRYHPFAQGYVLMALIAAILALAARATGGLSSPYVFSLQTMLYLWSLIMPGGAARAAPAILMALGIFFGLMPHDFHLEYGDVRPKVILLLNSVAAGLSLAYAEVLERWRKGASTASSVDALTELYNRRYLLERFGTLHAEARTEPRPISVLVLDIDHFKRVNDTLGHAAGDDVIRSVARTLAGSIRANDIAGRLGGEEFVLVLDHCDVGAATSVGERIRATIANTPLRLGAETLRATVSIGIATQPAGAFIEAETLLRAADDALYESKRAGRDRITIARLDELADGELGAPVPQT